VAGLATRRHGVVTHRQLGDAGLTDAEIRHRLESGALLREHRGVYRVGHRAPSVPASYLAAVSACGEGAFLSGRAAVHEWELVRGPAPAPEVTCPRERRIPGVLTRRCRRLDPRDTTKRDGIPIVTVARALVDVADVLSPEELARACHEAGVRYGTTPAQVEAALGRWPNAPGAAALRRVLRGEEKVTLSRLESRFLALLRTEGLPLPVTNRPAGGRRVDCRWVGERVTVELDSYAFHNSRHAWERDRVREREAYARGDQFRRYTWGDVFEQPTAMLGELRALLG
jgi:hypothetical protein